LTNADWWDRVVEARTKRERLMPQRVWTLHKGEHAAVIDLKAGARHRCGNRAHDRQEMAGLAVVDTRAQLALKAFHGCKVVS
jgi:hypothetical protein